MILRHLVPRHLAGGWSFYWRMNLPFWAELAYAVAVAALALQMDFSSWIARWMPAAAPWPYAANLLAGLAVYAAGRPLLRRGRDGLDRRWGSQFLRSQFGLFAGLDRFNRFLFYFLAALALLLLSRPDLLPWDSPLVRLWFWMFLLALLGAALVLVAVFGWLGEQMSIPVPNGPKSWT
jgi:hypothetical protein